ncbi:thiosulfate oxidation carrier protein SoxY [Bradyrhizobium prioriisuperbiae]|uniref:thiosulfate oxidation carrier protein SoxY n=1 Tax=Bradyrhizobium prioriisuperbiae TaxID=2854389 RepID=UPI0028EFBEB5|nr:thiosulfate oxidation carrier protein SoxY [Bradyrhizobium prioritasuperba]
MANEAAAHNVTRRSILAAAVAGGASVAMAAAPDAAGDADAIAQVRRLTGKDAALSPRLHLAMPAHFPNGYIVPLMLRIDSDMSEADHVRQVQVLAPRNPINPVATFHFVPGRSEPVVSTRIRLAEPQDVLVVAEMNDGALLMTRVFVEVATNGCN